MINETACRPVCRVLVHIVAKCHEENLDHYLHSYIKVCVSVCVCVRAQDHHMIIAKVGISAQTVLILQKWGGFVCLCVCVFVCVFWASTSVARAACPEHSANTRREEKEEEEEEEEEERLIEYESN